MISLAPSGSGASPEHEPLIAEESLLSSAINSHAPFRVAKDPPRLSSTPSLADLKLLSLSRF